MGFRVGGAENYTSRLWFLACQSFGSMAIVFTFVYDTRCPVRDVHVAGEPVWPYHLCYSKLGFGVRAECMPGTCSVVVQIIELSACLRVTFPFFRWSGWWWPRQGPCKLFWLAFHFCRCACRLTTSLTLTYWPYPDLSRTKTKYFILFCDTVIRMARSVSR